MIPTAPLWEGTMHNGTLRESFAGYEFQLTCDREWVYPPRFLAIWASAARPDLAVLIIYVT